MLYLRDTTWHKPVLVCNILIEQEQILYYYLRVKLSVFYLYLNYNIAILTLYVDISSLANIMWCECSILMCFMSELVL